MSTTRKAIQKERKKSCQGFEGSNLDFFISSTSFLLIVLISLMLLMMINTFMGAKILDL